MKYFIMILIIGAVGYMIYSWTGKNSDNKTTEPVVQQAEVELIDPVIDGVYAVDVANSSLAWHSSKIIGDDRDGKVSISSGWIEFLEGRVVAGEVVINMNSISEDTGTEALVNHLRGADFFNVAEYPESRLALIQSDVKEDNQNLRAKLTIMGKENEIFFPVTVNGNFKKAEAESEFSIDRTLWGIRFMSGKFFGELGDKAIKDEIGFKVKLSLIKE